MRQAWVLAAALLASPPLVFACLWDRDTPAEEARGMPEEVAVLTGRFPRNPPLYYEMRLTRVAKRLEQHPEDLEAYDDAGVACDRLGLGDEAIGWMTRKGRRLDASPDSPERRDHEYRYHANLGTFLVHRWIRGGADREKIDEVRAARQEIAEAIRINPNAHFGRESYQLRILDWLIDPPSGPFQELPNFLGLEPYSSPGAIRPAEAHKAVRGLTGLIVLGNAWESVDVYYALQLALAQDTEGFPIDDGSGRNSLALFAWLRCRELIRDGKGSMLPDAPGGQRLMDALPGPQVAPQAVQVMEPDYRSLRAEADAWQAARTKFMMDRLQQGRHPDDDPAFWTGYTETSAPELPSLSPKAAYEQAVRKDKRDARLSQIGFVVGFVGLVTAPLWIRRLLISRKKPAPVSDV
ncbi:hypothetical protein [Paludisphaera rhizosphaerae]|uniref:hypothetical protein n=1 Tax=Paludisphaera rhizosphaerae TaxID=2711216 RepID=UPI0013ECA327|nr:hypothetical protein [Paludisphaera rhizosphaerae]